jgi:hypothetical protein
MLQQPQCKKPTQSAISNEAVADHYSVLQFVRQDNFLSGEHFILGHKK